jgi:phosphate uptake regulator
METRKVQRTGKSTFIVSLPKSWATKNGIQAGSIVYITQSENGDLMLSIDRSEREIKTKLEIADRAGEQLKRDIMGCYLGGYRSIEVSSQSMTGSQKKDLHQIVNKLIGPEILEETVNKVIIQDLLSSEELAAEKALRRIRTIVKSMVQDALSAHLTGNRDLAWDVIQRDDDVDRLNLLIARQFMEVLRAGSMRQEALNSTAAFFFMQAASNLERIADHACRIAEIVTQCQYKPPNERAEEFAQLDRALVGLIDDALSCLLQSSSERANQLIDEAREIQRSSGSIAGSLGTTDYGDLMARLVVTGSVDRMLDYIVNIGELTIDLSHAGMKEARLGA